VRLQNTSSDNQIARQCNEKYMVTNVTAETIQCPVRPLLLKLQAYSQSAMPHKMVEGSKLPGARYRY
jgi:hypothetical protein